MQDLDNTIGLVSVLVPVYNVENFLSAALDSLIAQTYTHFEVILVNDGSTDHSALICEEYVVKDSRFKLVNQVNQGFGAARNTGLLYARGEFVYFMDSDDLIEPSLLNDVLKVFSKHPYDTVFFGFRKEYQQSNKVFDMIPPHLDCISKEESMEGILEMLYKGFGFGVWQQVFRRSFLLESGISFPALKREADIAFLLELYPSLTSFSTIPKVYYHYRAYYSSHKNNPDILANHVILYQLLQNLVSKCTKELFGDKILYRYFILWFCHVIPLHILMNKNYTQTTRLKAFKALANHPVFVSSMKSLGRLSLGSGFQKIILFLYGFRSAVLIYFFTEINYFFKFRIRINYKKYYYRNLSSLAK